MFGGSDPAVPNLVPADITVAGNYVTKQVVVAHREVERQEPDRAEERAPRGRSPTTCSRTTGKAASPGYAIVFTVRNQDGKCPWCQVDHVTFERNIVRHSRGRHQDSRLGQQPPEPADAGDPDPRTTCSTTSTARRGRGGNGYFVALTDGARDITVDHNTRRCWSTRRESCRSTGRRCSASCSPTTSPSHGNYGIAGTGHGIRQLLRSPRFCRAPTSRAT